MGVARVQTLRGILWKPQKPVYKGLGGAMEGMKGRYNEPLKES